MLFGRLEAARAGAIAAADAGAFRGKNCICRHFQELLGLLRAPAESAFQASIGHERQSPSGLPNFALTKHESLNARERRQATISAGNSVIEPLHVVSCG